MSSSNIENLNRSKEEAKESEADYYDPIDDEFLRTAFRNRIDAPQNLGLSKDVKNAQVTFIIGESGSGKSTLASFLENSRLTAKFDGTCWLFSGDKKSKVVIGNTTSSCTELPTRIVGSDGLSVYYDFPGFFDNRDTAKEIACSFYLKTLIDQTETFRIILTVDYYMFQCGRSRAFIDLVDYLQGLFPDINLLLKALFVVVTKVPSKESIQATNVSEIGTIEAIQDKVRKFLKDSKGLKSRIRSILIWLADSSQSNRIEVFRQPSKPGEIDNATLQNVLAKLENVFFIEKHAIELYVPKNTEYYIIKLVERLQNKMNVEVLKIIQKIEEICHRKIQTSSFEELTKFIELIKGHIIENDLDYQENKNLAGFLCMLSLYKEKINSHCSSPIEPFNFKTLKKTMDSMITLKEIMPTKEFNVELWCHQFQALKDRLIKIIHFDCSEEKKGVLQIKGIAIKAKKLEPLLKEGLNSIEIYCFGAIFFDEVNIQCKKANIAIIAPLWRINGTNVIDISGKDGLPFSQKEYSNFDGQPGNPGGNAGNFLGIREKYVGNGELKIIANGGKGGPGLDEWENKIEELSQRKPKAEIKKPELEPKRPQFIDLESELQNNEKRGGKGGHGGCGGNPGRVMIPDETNNNMLKIIIETKQGKNGDNGRPVQKIDRREELPLPKDAAKDQKKSVPVYLTVIQRCCGLNNISDEPRQRQSIEKRGLGSVTEISENRLTTQRNNRLIEINFENLIEPSPNDFHFHEIKETYNHYFNEAVREEGLQGIIGETSFIRT